jgi:hypothetical protein
MMNVLDIFKNMQSELGKGRSAPPDDQFIFDRDTQQVSFEFKSPPQICFVADLKSLKPIVSYSALPEIPLSETGQNTVNKISEQLLGTGGHDGKQMLIAGAVYDPERNRLYLETRRAPYSLIQTLASGHLKNEPAIQAKTWFKTGVMMPFITQDDYTIFVKRAKEGLYSSASGFLQSTTEASLITLVSHTIEQELWEEFALQCKQWSLKSVSCRRTTGKRLGTIEFIAPCELTLNRDELINRIENNTAQDAYEHTNQHFALPLMADKRQEAVAVLKNPYPGWPLHNPMLISASIQANLNPLRDFTPSRLPYSGTRAFSVEAFAIRRPTTPSLSGPLFFKSCKENSQKEDLEPQSLVQRLG